MSYLGMNVYCDDFDQRRLLLDNLRFWAQEARSQGILNLFWYRRSDARGPHLFLVFGENGEHTCLREFLGTRIAAFLGGCQTSYLSPADVERRHRHCLGKILSPPDLDLGLSTMNSSVVFDLGPSDYPLSLTDQLSSKDIFWRYVDALTACLLDQVETGIGPMAAMACCRGIHRSLAVSGVSPQQYWQRHAERLLPILQRRTVDSDWAKHWLHIALSNRNRQILSRLWDQTDPRVNTAVEISENVVSTIMRDEQVTAWDTKLPVLLETTDLMFHQLWLPISIQTVMVLYAWSHSLLD